VTAALTFDGRRGAGGGWRTAGLAVAVAVVAGAALQAPVAHAEDARAAARKKLGEGTELLRAGDYPSALECFQAAYALVPSSKIEYSLGLAYMRLARNAEALAAFDVFLRDTLDASELSLNRARAYREDLSRKVARVVVHADVDGASIGIDGRSYGTTPRDAEIVIDAGAHLLLVEEPGAENVFARRFVVPPGGELIIGAKVQRDQPEATTREAPAVAGEPESRTRDLPRWIKPAALVASGVAVAALGFGTYQWIAKEQKYSAFNQSCGRGSPDNGGGSCSRLLADGDRAKRLGIISFSAGLALGAVSASFWVWNMTHAPAAKETALACAPTVATAGGVCQVRF
jgi:tetratricopeptide (TPR) repeat protein